MPLTPGEALDTFANESHKLKRITNADIAQAFADDFPGDTESNQERRAHLYGFLNGATYAAQIITRYLGEIDEHPHIVPSIYNFRSGR